MKLLTLLLALTAFPGEALLVQVPSEPELEAVTLEWSGRRVEMAAAEQGYFALLGIDLDVKPGNHSVQAEYRYTGGRRDYREIPLTVVSKDYPVTRLEVAPKYVELSADNQERTARERQQINAAYATASAEPYWEDDFLIPVDGATGGRNFGNRRVFNDQPRAPHSGADLSAATGTEIMATNRGKVILTGDFFFNGNSVFVDHGMGVISMYLHLSEILVTEGDIVDRGAVVGLAGATGRVTGPHLHWGMKVTGARVDPFTLPGIGGSESGVADE